MTTHTRGMAWQMKHFRLEGRSKCHNIVKKVSTWSWNSQYTLYFAPVFLVDVQLKNVPAGSGSWCSSACRTQDNYRQASRYLSKEVTLCRDCSWCLCLDLRKQSMMFMFTCMSLMLLCSFCPFHSSCFPMFRGCHNSYPCIQSTFWTETST